MRIRIYVLLVITLALGAVPARLLAQGTAFSFQGQLATNGTPANGLHDFLLNVYSASSGGALIAGPYITTTLVTNGLFTVTPDFGAGVFTGPARWLDIQLRPTGGGGFTPLGQRQAILAAPYSMFAGTVSNVVSGAVVKSLNGLKDNVLLAAGANMTLATNGNTLTLASTGGSGVWSLNGSSAYYNGGNVGIGTNGPLENLTIGGVVKVGLRLTGSTALGTGLAMENTSAGGRKFDLYSVGSSGFPFGASPGTFGIFDETFGAYRLAINSLGQVGIGTAMPTCLLDVGWNANDLFHLSAPMPFMTFRDTSAANARGIIYSAGGALALYTENYWNGSNPVGFLKLASSGNVGVGTDTPQGRLEIAGSDDGLRINGSQPYLTFYDSVNYRSRIQGYGGDVMLETEGYISGTATNNFAVLRGNGSFCIGTRLADANVNVANVQSYNSGLKLSGSSPSGTGLALENTSAGGHKYAVLSGGSSDGIGAGAFGIFDDTAGAYRFSINPAGQVGINTFAPQSSLDIVTSQDALRMTGYQPFLTLRDSNAGNARGVIQNVSGGLNFLTDSYLTGAGPNNFILLSNSGNVGIGTANPLAKLDVAGTTRTCVLTIVGGCDLAEPFAVQDGELPKGSVVVIDKDHPGRLKQSTRSYDKRVAGIVSGANGINAGISLHQEGAFEPGQNVALSGRVYVLADASNGGIEPGDLLTTSGRPGHAMKVTDFSRAQGAVLGKAMSGLEAGQGMVLVLVTLQ